jgi:hypothetical protein
MKTLYLQNSHNFDTDYSDDEKSKSRELYISQKLIEIISSTLHTIIKDDKKPKKSQKEYDKIFNHSIDPEISLYDYLSRIHKYLSINDSTLIISLIYIDRICKNKGVKLTKNNIHRILFSSILASIKFNEDKIYPNSFYAKIVGISVKELTKLESVFLKLIDFKLFISDEIYNIYSTYLYSFDKISNN